MTLSDYLNPITGKQLTKDDLCDYTQWVEGELYKIPLLDNTTPIFISHDTSLKQDEYLNIGENPYFNDASELTPLLHNRRVKCTLELIRRLDLNNAKILDIACGDGIVTKAIKERFPEFNVYGLDISLTAIKNAINDLHIDYMVADAFYVPMNDNVFDVIICNNFWEHVTNPTDLAIEAKRLLKSGGYYIISTPSRYSFANLWSVIRGKQVALQNPHCHVTEYTIGQMIEMLHFAGFEVESVVSEPLPLLKGSIKTKLRHSVVKPIMELYIKHCGSHHNLETTVLICSKAM